MEIVKESFRKRSRRSANQGTQHELIRAAIEDGQMKRRVRKGDCPDSGKEFSHLVCPSLRGSFRKSHWVLACRPSDSPKQELTEHRVVEGLGTVARHAAEDAARAGLVTPEHRLGGPGRASTLCLFFH